MFLSSRVNLDVLLYSPYRKINLHALGRYFSMMSVNSSNEHGFLKFSDTSIFHFIEEFLFDEAVKMTMFFDSTSPSFFSDWIMSHPLNSGIATSSKMRSKF